MSEMLTKVVAAIRAKVPEGYGMTKDEALDYARAAVGALPLAEWLSEWESAEAMVDQEFGLSTDPVVVNVPLAQLRELVRALKP